MARTWNNEKRKVEDGPVNKRSNSDQCALGASMRLWIQAWMEGREKLEVSRARCSCGVISTENGGTG